MYHAAPLRPLSLVQERRSTRGQFVPTMFLPTMFVRMLELPAEVRDSYDVSSSRVAVHAAAPCPVGVEHRVIEWWGPVLEEYHRGHRGRRGRARRADRAVRVCVRPGSGKGHHLPSPAGPDQLTPAPGQHLPRCIRDGP